MQRSGHEWGSGTKETGKNKQKNSVLGTHCKMMTRRTLQSVSICLSFPQSELILCNDLIKSQHYQFPDWKRQGRTDGAEWFAREHLQLLFVFDQYCRSPTNQPTNRIINSQWPKKPILNHVPFTPTSTVSSLKAGELWWVVVMVLDGI